MNKQGSQNMDTILFFDAANCIPLVLFKQHSNDVTVVQAKRGNTSGQINQQTIKTKASAKHFSKIIYRSLTSASDQVSSVNSASLQNERATAAKQEQCR